MYDAEELRRLLSFFNTGRMPDISKLFSNDISKPEYIILMMCKHMNSQGKTVYVSDLVKEFLITPQAVSKQLRSCEKKGYIERHADQANRRNIIVSLTEQGERVFAESQRETEILRERILRKIDVEEYSEVLRRICELCDILRETIEEISRENRSNGSKEGSGELD